MTTFRLPFNRRTNAFTPDLDEQVYTDLPVREVVLQNALVQAWMDRLQVLSVVTTFFASMDGTLLSIAAEEERGLSSSPNELASACLAGALILHVIAAILAFTASFVLVRYRIIDAGGPSSSITPVVIPLSAPPSSSRTIQIEDVRPFRLKLRRTSVHANVNVNSEPPLRLLTRCNTLCMVLCALGFILSLTGVMGYSWVRLSRRVSIFVSVCLGVSVSAGVVVVVT